MSEIDDAIDRANRLDLADRWIITEGSSDEELAALIVSNLRREYPFRAAAEHGMDRKLISERIRNISLLVKQSLGENSGISFKHSENYSYPGPTYIEFTPYFPTPLEDDEPIRRYIEFPSEYKQAGIAILNYFGKVVNDKYPEMEVGVTIEQQGNKVALIVTTPQGEQERFEQEFENYALMVQGKLAPEEYFGSQMEVLAWKQKYEITALELRLAKELKDAQIGDLRQQVQFLGRLITQSQSTHAELIATIRELSKQASDTTQGSFDTILEVLEHGFTAEKTDAFLEALKNIQQRDKNVFQKLVGFISTSAIGGAIGNEAHAKWVEIVNTLKALVP